MMSRKTLAMLCFGVTAAMIAVLTLVPLPLPPVRVAGGDKTRHLIAFGALVAPVAFLWPRALLWIIPAAIAYGGLIELIQPRVGRMAEWGDFRADTLGVCLGAATGLLLRALRRFFARR